MAYKTVGNVRALKQKNTRLLSLLRDAAWAIQSDLAAAGWDEVAINPNLASRARLLRRLERAYAGKQKGKRRARR